MDTSFFTEAIQIAARTDPILNPTRRQAEEYLTELRDSGQGLALAYHILTTEKMDSYRAFWAFNAIIHHLQKSAHAFTDADSDNLYNLLMDWISRMCREGQLDQFVRNKFAQLMVVGLQVFFPDRWCTFFQDWFKLLELRENGNDQVVLLFLRVFECIDERVVDRDVPRTKEQRLRDTAIKDTMREVAIPSVVNVWYNILGEYHGRRSDVCRLCLDVLQTYIDWIDIGLILRPEWINMMYFFFSNPALRDGACECFCMIVEKKMQDLAMKVEVVRSLRLVEALPRMVPEVMASPITSEEEEAFLLQVSRLAVSVATEMCNCVGACADAPEMAHTSVRVVASVCETENFSVREIVLPFMQQYIKSSMMLPEEMTLFLGVIGRQTPFPRCYNPDNDMHDVIIEQRKQIFNVIRLFHRREPNLVLDHCQNFLQSAIQKVATATYHEVEAALRYIFELGEGMRMEQLRDLANPFTIMVRSAMQGGFIHHQHPLVHLAYFELLDRYSQVFVFHRDCVSTLLNDALLSQNGVLNADSKARSRICYLVSHMTSSLKVQLAPHAMQILQALRTPLFDPQSRLSPQEKGDLYEALGALVSATDDVPLTEVAGEVVTHMNGVVAAASTMPMTDAASLVSDDIQFLASLAKGFGGVDTTRPPESPTLGPTPTPQQLQQQQAESKKQAAGSAFLHIAPEVLKALMVFEGEATVRERTVLFMHQVINILGVDCIASLEQFVRIFVPNATIVELPKVIRLGFQAVQKTRKASAQAMGQSILPIIVRKFGEMCNVKSLEVVHNVLSEDTRQHLDTVKHFFMLLVAITSTSCIRCFNVPEAQQCIPAILNCIVDGMSVNPELEVPKQALLVLSNLTTSWCVPESDTEKFLFQVALPAMMMCLTSPALDLRDSKAYSFMSEGTQLLKTVVTTLGERGLLAIFALVSGFPFQVPHDEAEQMCCAIRDEPKLTTAFKLKFKAMLSQIQARRAAMNPGA